MQTYEHPITIQPADIDVMNHVNNVVYLQWVQDAVAHWITVLNTIFKLVKLQR